MFSRKIRWMSAALVAAVALLVSPNRSNAAVEVLIMEGSTVLFSGTVAANGQVSTSSASYSSINLGFQNAYSSLNSSFSTSIGITTVAGLDMATAPVLTITAQDTGPTGTGITGIAGSNATLTNAVSVTSSIPLQGGGSGNQTLTGTTSVVDFPSNNLVGQSTSDTATSPFGSDGSSTAVQNLSGLYSLIQNFTISFSGTGNATAATAPGTVSAGLTVEPAPVPAPPAVLLGAIALPIFGMRRYLRRKTV